MCPCDYWHILRFKSPEEQDLFCAAMNIRIIGGIATVLAIAINLTRFEASVE